MKVVLTENVKGIGKKLDVVNVSEGYARNYLIPRKLATFADNKSLSEANTKKEAIKYKQDTERDLAIKKKEKIEQVKLEFRLKAAEGGKLFGSVTSKEVGDVLKEKTDIDIDKKKIIIEESIKTVGEYAVKVKLYEGIIATLKIVVLEK